MADKLEIRREFIANVYPPGDARRGGPCILVLGGSEGGLPDFFAQMFVSQGYGAMALAYCGLDPLAPRVDGIPLEYVEAAIGWYLDREETTGAPLIVAGISKGAELALLLASLDPRIGGVIAYAPSAVVFEGIPDPQGRSGSSWTRAGAALRFVGYDSSGNRPPEDFYGLYADSLRQAEAVAGAAIAVEQINGPVLLFSGGEDRMWPSKEMAEMIVRRLEERGFCHPFEHHSFARAGHVFSEYVAGLGGTADANRDAGRQSAEIAFRWLGSLPAK